MLAGAVSALAGVYYTLRYGSARGDNATGLELQVIAAVLLGGVSIFGGRGALHGVVAGVLLIGVISSAMRLDGQTVNVINIVIGVLLVLSVMSTSLLAWVSSLRSARTGARGPSAPAPTALHLHLHQPISTAAPQKHHREAATMKLNRRVSALAAITLIAGLGLTACGDDSDSAGDGGKGGDGGGDLSVTFLPKNLGNPYFDTSDAGGKKAIDEFGGKYEEVGPDTGTPDAQVPFINTAAQQGVSALVVSANDKSAICDALNEAGDAGVKVVTFDSDTDPECRDLYINQADAAGIAKVQVDMIADQIGDEGEVAILSAAANATNQNEWIGLMEEDLAANHPNIKLVDTVYGDDDDQTSFDKTAALLSPTRT